MFAGDILFKYMQFITRTHSPVYFVLLLLFANFAHAQSDDSVMLSPAEIEWKKTLSDNRITSYEKREYKLKNWSQYFTAKEVHYVNNEGTDTLIEFFVKGSETEVFRVQRSEDICRSKYRLNCMDKGVDSIAIEPDGTVYARNLDGSQFGNHAVYEFYYWFGTDGWLQQELIVVRPCYPYTQLVKYFYSYGNLSTTDEYLSRRAITDSLEQLSLFLHTDYKYVNNRIQSINQIYQKTGKRIITEFHYKLNGLLRSERTFSQRKLIKYSYKKST